MKNKRVLIVVIVLVAALGAIIFAQSYRSADSNQKQSPVSQQTGGTQHPPLRASAPRVPAHLTEPPSRASLRPVLPPENFIGKTREAYRAVGEIPQTIAQLPCYCYCDQSIGHKSLHSCFEDDHAAHCAVCVNEALEAYRLQKEGMTPEQIRERIVAQYSTMQ
jgi:hypothetical protein